MFKTTKANKQKQKQSIFKPMGLQTNKLGILGKQREFRKFIKDFVYEKYLHPILWTSSYIVPVTAKISEL